MDKQCNICETISNVRKHETKCKVDGCKGTLRPMPKKSEKRPKGKSRKRGGHPTHPVEQHSNNH